MEVSYRIAADAKATMPTEKTKPKVKSNKILHTIRPRATNPVNLRTPPKNEKSLRVVKAIVVNPANMSSVRMAAVGITVGSE